MKKIILTFITLLLAGVTTTAWGQRFYAPPGDGHSGETGPGTTGTEVNVADAIAKIGDKGYATLEAAIAAATDGQTIEIIADGPMGDDVTIENKEITIVGEGVITLNTSTGQEITIGEGGILNVGASDGTSDITFDGENRYYGSLFNIKDGGIVNMYDGVKTENIQINGMVVRLNGESPVFNMYGGSITSSGGAEMGVVAIESGNGVINIEGGTISYSGEDQIYSVLMIANSHGTVNMKGGEIIASDKVFMAVMITDNGDEGYAKFNMTGGTITSLNTTYHYAIEAYEGESVTISGGNINGLVEGDDNYDGTIVITGGTFDYDVSPLLVGTEYIASKNEGTPETWTVTMGAATVTDADNNVTNYATLAEAFTAANAASGSTLTLLNDIEVTNDDLNGVTDTPPYLVTGKFTLDLNGKTIEYTGTSTLTTGVIGVKRGGDLTVTDSSDEGNGEINSGDKAYAAIAVTVKGEAATGDAAKLTVNGGTITGDYYAITGNGSRHDSEITINGGVIKGNHEGDNLGIYHPQDGKLTITDGEISGYSSAIEVRSGELTITGGTFTVESTSYSCTPNGSGTTTVGAAVAIAQHTTNKAIHATISGGTFNASGNAVKLSVSNPHDNAFDNVTVSGLTDLIGENNRIPEGFCWKEDNNGVSSLVLGVASITDGDNTTYYASLGNALTAVANGQTITLMSNVTLDANVTSPLTAGQSFLLELGNYTVTNTVGDDTYSVQLVKGAMAKTSKAADIFSIKDDVTDATIVSGLTHAQTGHYAYYAATTTKEVAYVNEEGDETTTPEDRPVVVIDSNMDEMIGLDQNGWFVVNDDVELSNLKAIGTGEVYLILADGNTLTHSNDNGLIVDQLTVYGQSEQSGKMTLTSTLGKSDANAKITINGGIVIVNSGDEGTAMKAGEIKVNAGQVEAHGAHGMVEITGSTIILGLSDDPDDYIIADTYEGTVQIADGQTLYDSNDSYKSYTGTLTDAQKAAIAGHKLVKSVKYAAQIFNSNNEEIGNYETLKDAFAAVEDGQTIKLLKDINLNSGGLGSADNNNFTCPLESGTITIDYNGKNITAANRYIRLNNGIKVITNKVYTNDLSRPTYFSNADANSIAVAGLIDETDKYFQVTVLAKTADVPYVDEHGADQVAAYSVPLTSDLGTTVFLGTGSHDTDTWYHLTDDASFKSLLYTHNNTATIILTDEKTLTVSGGPIQGTNSAKGNLVLYGQTEQTGKLNASWQGNRSICMLTYTQNGGIVESTGSIDANQITINEGNLTVTGNGGGYAPLGRLNVTSSSFVNINGGVVDVKRTAKTGANGNAIQTYAVNITDGQLTAESTNNAIYAEGNITITGGKTTVKSNEEENNYGMYAGGNITMSLTKNDEYINSINGKYHASSITLPLPGLYAQGTGDHYQGVVPATDINNKKLVLQPYEAVIDFGGDKGEVFYMTLAEADKHDQNGTYVIRLLHNIESPYTMGASPDSIMRIYRNDRSLTIAAPRGYFVKAETNEETVNVDGVPVNNAKVTTYWSIPVSTAIATVTYNAKPQLPEVTVTDLKNNGKLELGTDFKVVTVNTDGYTDASEYVDAIRIVGIVEPDDTQEDGYIADIYSNFTILPLNLTDFVVSAIAPYVAAGYGANNSESGAAVKEAATITIINGNGDAISDELSAVLQITIDNDPTPANNYNNAGLYEGVVHVAPFANADVDYSSNFTGSIAAGNLVIGDAIDITNSLVVSTASAIYTSEQLPPSKARMTIKLGNKELVYGTDYIYTIHGKAADFIDAKTYSNAVTIKGIGKYSGEFNADYTIFQRDLSNKYVHCEEDQPIEWKASNIKLNVNNIYVDEYPDLANNVNLYLEVNDIHYNLKYADYTWQSDRDLKDPGEYTITFIGRGNFTGQTQVKVRILKDIDLLAVEDIVIPVQILGSVTPNIRPSNIQDMVVTDGTNVLELGTHYTLTFTDGVTTYQGGEGPYITEPGKYTAIIKGEQPYYSGEKRKNFAVVNEYYAADATQNEQSEDNKYGVHITSGKDMTATVGAKNGAAVSSDTKTLTLSRDVVVSTPSPRDTTVTFTLAGIDDNAFAGCNQLSWIDATAIENYTPTTLTREFDGPFNGVPKQTLVFLNGTNVTGENYVYQVSAGVFNCDEFKVYDDMTGIQVFNNEDYDWFFANPYQFTANSITNTRKMTAGQYYTLCLPYELTLPTSLKAYTLDASSATLLGFKEVTGTLAAYTPYIVLPQNTGNLLNVSTGGTVAKSTYTEETEARTLNAHAGGNYSLVGSMDYFWANPTTGGDIYIMQSGNEWKKLPTGTNGYPNACVLPMRAYIQAATGTSGGTRLFSKFVDKDGSTTSISNLQIDADDNKVFDLQGRRVTNPQRGNIYIINGRKMMYK